MALIASSFIADTDLQEFMPDVLDYGVTTFAPQSLRASDDVYNRILTEWWPDAVSRRFGLILNNYDVNSSLLPVLDTTVLDTVALKAITAYRTISHYAMPMLASDADANGDLFSRRADRYSNFYHEEWAKIILLPIYDFNNDGQFTNIERRGKPVKRMMRA